MKISVALGMILAAGLASTAMASTSAFSPVASVTFTNRASVDGLNDVDNITSVGTVSGGGTVTGIRVTGSLTQGIAGNWANEARVRLTPGAGNAFTGFNLGAANPTQVFTGTLPIGPIVLPVTSFTLAAGDVNFQWYESFDDGAGADATWDTVTYDFGSNAVFNGNFALGSLPNTATPVTHAGSHVAGGLDFFTFSIADAVAHGGGYLNIATSAGATGSMSDTELALYDSLGNLVWTDDDSGPGFFSEMSFGSSDPLAAPDLVAGSSGANLAAGSYTLVTGGYDTVFAATLAGTHTPGTNAGNYNLALTYVPAPGALALLGLGGLVATRRRR
jgi:hypothetical protein